MDASEQFAFPSPQPQDAPEVRQAIEQAGILWSDDPKESLKWLRKAAEFASDAGDDLRSVQLARVSADLRNLANISPSVPPPTTLPPISHPVAVPVSVPTEAVEAVNVAPMIAAVASEQPVENAPASEAAAAPVWSSAENTVRDQVAVDPQATPDVPMVAAVEAMSAAKPAEPVGIPQFNFSKDPAQTVPATPAASAAALLAATPGNHQAMPMAPVAAPVASNGFAGGPLAAKRPATGLLGGEGAANPGGPRPEQPTLVGRPLTGPRGVNDETPAATPAAIQADSVAPGSTTRFVQHKAIAVAISMAPNANGHFDLHPLADGESVEPGFRRALLVALAPEDRLFPGRA